jgi:uncharacterized protein (DUF2267 family)
MTRRIAMNELLERLAHRGLVDEVEARASLRATLTVLGERLVDDEAKVLAEVVPDEIAESIEESEYDSDFGTEELFERVRRREHISASRARENAEIVLLALGECLSAERRRRVARGLPEQAAELLLGARELGEPPPHPSARHASSRTLAEARPGSKHPLSEAAPPQGHTHSVAVNPAPHAETKLSAAKGLTQERLGETLGTGHPPSSARPIADAGRSK